MNNITKTLALVLLAMLAVSCNTEPVVKPNITSDSAMTMKIKSSIGQGQQVTTGWSWILWYIPVLFLVVSWGWREFVAKRPKDCPPVNRAKKKKRKQTKSASSTVAPASPPIKE